MYRYVENRNKYYKINTPIIPAPSNGHGKKKQIANTEEEKLSCAFCVAWFISKSIINRCFENHRGNERFDLAEYYSFYVTKDTFL